jgi:hypothetical protein
MPKQGEIEQQGHIYIDSVDVGVEEMVMVSQISELTNWTRNELDGLTGDANIIQTAVPVLEQDLDDIPDDYDDSDDIYVNDGHVAPVSSLGQGIYVVISFLF